MDDIIWDKHFKVTDAEWSEIYNKAVIIWDNLNDIERSEVNSEPVMHPCMFLNLSGVRGFNSLNGYTYEEYINGWRKRNIMLNVG